MIKDVMMWMMCNNGDAEESFEVIGDVMMWMWGNNLDAERKSGMMGMLWCGIIGMLRIGIMCIITPCTCRYSMVLVMV